MELTRDCSLWPTVFDLHRLPVEEMELDSSWSLVEGLDVVSVFDATPVLEGDDIAEFAVERMPDVEESNAEPAGVSRRERNVKTLKKIEHATKSRGRCKKLPATRMNKMVSGPSRFPKSLWHNFWIMGSAGEPCTFKKCRFAQGPQKVAARRHFHPRCTHTHKTGVNAGLMFATVQVDKAEKHQKLHPEFK